MKNLSSHTKIDCVDLDLNFSNSSSKNSQTGKSSSLTIVQVQKMKNSSETSYQLLQSSQQESTVLENIEQASRKNSGNNSFNHQKIIYSIQKQPKLKIQNNSVIKETMDETKEIVKEIENHLNSRGNQRKPFWNSHVRNISNKLWLPAMNVCSDLDEISDFQSYPVESKKSLCSMNIQVGNAEEIPSQFLQTLKSQDHPSFGEQNNNMSEIYREVDGQRILSGKICIPNVQEKCIRSLKIRFFVSIEQKNILNMWFGAYRWFFNEAKRFSEEHKIYSFDNLRNSMKINKKYPVPKKWNMNLIPPRIITGAIKDYCSAFSSGMALYRNGNIKYFHIDEKRKKHKTQTLNISKDCFSKNNILFSKLDFHGFHGLELDGYYKYKSKRSKKKRKIKINRIPIDHDCRISYRNNKFYLLIPCSKERLERIKLEEPTGLEKTKKVINKVIKDKFCEAKLKSGKKKGKICGLKVTEESETKKYCKRHLSLEKVGPAVIPVLQNPSNHNLVHGDQKFCVVSIDSGIRTFQTGYCPEGYTVEIGKNIFKKLFPLYMKLDKLNGKYFGTREDGSFTKEGRRRRSIISKQEKRIYEKISNKIDDMHWKTIKFLTENYKVIVISDFKTKQLLGLKNLPKSSKRNLSSLAHYRFRQRLIEKCQERGVFLFIMDESYTSKTCGRCGRINQSLGAKKIFKCPHCHYKADRDINAGRNILLKLLVILYLSPPDATVLECSSQELVLDT